MTLILAINQKKIILKNIFLSIDMESKVGVIGSNGIGKTTLVKLIMGKLIPTSGELIRNRNARIALFTQHHVDQLNLDLSAVEFIFKIFGQSEYLINKKNKIQIIRKKLGRFNITGKQQTEKIKYLSGGQKSRIALCIMAWQKPHFLIMDEPTNHLDHETIDALINSIKGTEKNSKFQGGVLLISHDQHFLTKVSKEFGL